MENKPGKQSEDLWVGEKSGMFHICGSRLFDHLENNIEYFNAFWTEIVSQVQLLDCLSFHKYTHPHGSVNKCLSEVNNGVGPKRRQVKMATSQNGDKPKRLHVQSKRINLFSSTMDFLVNF